VPHARLCVLSGGIQRKTRHRLVSQAFPAPAQRIDLCRCFVVERLVHDDPAIFALGKR
jgi:hypothetical protein